MILKGSQRGNGADIATHLLLTQPDGTGLDTYANERVEVAEIYGTVATDLHGFAAEIEAIAKGTKAKNAFYSLSINPPYPMTREQYAQAREFIMWRLGLADQPYALVFHIKDGREHCHLLISKIDAVAMKAIHMAFDHSKLCDCACDLAHEFGFELPQGLRDWEQKNRERFEKIEPSQAENAIAKDTGITPAQRKELITNIYNHTDDTRSLESALLEAGYVLAFGDRRALIIVDQHGNPFSLSRYVKGVKAKDIKARLAAFLDDQQTDHVLPDFETAKQQIQSRHDARNDLAVERARAQAIEALAQSQAARRAPLLAKEQDLMTLHAAERLSLHAAQLEEKNKFYYRIKTAVLKLLNRSPALRSVLGPITRSPRLNPKERHRLENTALDERHQRERAIIDAEKRGLEKVVNREIRQLAKALAKQLTETDSQFRSYDPEIHASESLHRMHQDLVDIRLDREFEDGLTKTFNRYAEQKTKKKKRKDNLRGELKSQFDKH